MRPFRVGTEGPDGRLVLAPIASVNLGKGTWKARGGASVGPADETAIRAWMDARRTRAEDAPPDQALRALGAAADWVQSEASAEDIGASSSDLLLAIHDLRAALTRRIAKDADDQPPPD